MKRTIWIFITLILLLVAVFYIFKNNQSEQVNKNIETISRSLSDRTHFIYFTGVGCPHCANVDPVLLKDRVRNKNLMVIEYEIYQQRQNAPLLMDYNNNYKSGLGIPLIIAGDCKDNTVIGDASILKYLDEKIDDNKANCIVLPDLKVPFENLNISEIPGLPKIWYKNRLAVKEDIKSDANEIIKAFLIDGIIPENAKKSDKNQVSLSGDKIKFKTSIVINGWNLMSD